MLWTVLVHYQGSGFGFHDSKFSSGFQSIMVILSPTCPLACEFSDQDKVDLILLTILPIVLFNLFMVGTHEERLAKRGSKQQDGWER